MKEKQSSSPLHSEQQAQNRDRCLCLPLSPLQRNEILANEEAEKGPAFLPVTSALDRKIQTTLTDCFPRSTPLSLLLLHITQFEHISMPPTAPTIHQRLKYHAPASLLEQIVLTIRRTLRIEDEILQEEHGTGAAILFPQVDLEGVSLIARRISHSIKLLQAETIIPPLQYETEIILGFGAFPWPANSLEILLYHAGLIQEKITFRPAVLPQPLPEAQIKPRSAHTPRLSKTGVHAEQENSIPFMHIPGRLPTRLKQLIPHALARELHCAPVGRDHQRLTVAMANPRDTHAISRLQETTGLTIFPVSCEVSALEALLASGW
jgi:hypothetical protein